VPPVGVRRIYTLGGEVIKLFKVCIPMIIDELIRMAPSPSSKKSKNIHHDLLLISVFERL
jgi:hypothetical protein